MKKNSLLASAAVASVALAAVPVFAQGGPFADVPVDHWAYSSVDKLQKQGVVIGYPDGTFGGKRAMTRYEFAVAIARLIDKIPPPPAPPGPAGITTEQLNAALGPYVTRDQMNTALADYAKKSDLAGFATKDEVATLRSLVNEFQTELQTLGKDVAAIKTRLDAVEGRLTAIETEMKRVKIGGAFNVMARGNNRRGSTGAPFIDYDGYASTGGPGSRGSILADSRVMHDVDLNIKARLSDTATATAVLNFGNYLPFLNTITSYGGARSSNPLSGGTPSQSQESTIYKLMVEAPVGGFNFGVGRIPIQFTPYTLKLIDVDSYFSNDKTDLGDIPLDGAKVQGKLGPLGVTVFAAKASPIKYENASGVGASSFFPGFGLFAGAGQAPFSAAGRFIRPTQSLISPVGGSFYRSADNGAMAVDNIAGGRATFGVAKIGTVGVTGLAMGGPTPNAGGGSGTNFDRVWVYGADADLNFSGIGVVGSYTVSNTASAAGQSGGSSNTVRDDDTYAWDAGAKYTMGALNIGAGYKYISPYFAAPGYWDKIGAWTNPVDVKGPYVNASYALGAGLTLTGEGKFYRGTGKGVLNSDDKVNNFKGGLKYGLTSASAVDLGVEYSEYRLSYSNGKPQEIFYNIGYGYSFNPSTSFKLLYQIVDYKDKGTGFDPLSDKGGVGAAQFSIKF